MHRDLCVAQVRNDDTLTLEFISPVLPKVLQLMRAPPKEKKKGKGGGAGKGKGGAGKGKKGKKT